MGIHEIYYAYYFDFAGFEEGGQGDGEGDYVDIEGDEDSRVSIDLALTLSTLGFKFLLCC